VLSPLLQMQQLHLRLQLVQKTLCAFRAPASKFCLPDALKMCCQLAALPVAAAPAAVAGRLQQLPCCTGRLLLLAACNCEAKDQQHT